MRREWTREELIIVLSLYFQLPFKNSSKNHPQVIECARLIGRSPSAVNMKIGNFGSFDTTLQRKGITGLVNVSKLDERIWNEFYENWDALSQANAELLQQLRGENEGAQREVEIPLGGETIAMRRQRTGQSFFRQAVLSAYGACCITGIATEQLLVASHIKPWSESAADEKVSPQNGLCLNALHDKAFDVGFITVMPNLEIRVSDAIHDIYSGEIVVAYFKQYNRRRILLPERMPPKKDFLEYHNDVIFEKWKR